jgi:hypothetical protein
MFNKIGACVSDMKSMEFYGDVIGMELKQQVED